MTAADPLVTTVITVLAIVVVVGPLTWLLLRWFVEGGAKTRERLMKAARARTRATIADDSGDQGGHPNPIEHASPRPKAPETGSGLLVEDVLDMPKFLQRKAGDVCGPARK